MFSAKQAVDEELPPTQGTFLPAIGRVNFQTMLWAKNNESRPNKPSAVGHGGITEDGTVKLVTCDLSCAPELILKLFKCSCGQSRCAASCKCCINGLPQTETCAPDDHQCDSEPM